MRATEALIARGLQFDFSPRIGRRYMVGEAIIDRKWRLLKASTVR